MKKIPANWWKTSFGKSYIKQYKWQEKLTDIQVSFILKNTNKGVTLDAGCGYGRITKPLSWFNPVVGVDQSKELLPRVFDKWSIYMRFDIRNLVKHKHWFNRFDNVISIFTSFGYFNDRDNFKTLKGFAKVLKKDGVLILDLSNPHHESVKPHIVDKYIIFDRELNPGRVRAYTKTELSKLAQKAGFKSFKWFGWYDGSKYKKDSKRLILVAKKK